MTELPKPDSVLNEEYNISAKSVYQSVYNAQSSAKNKEDLVYSRIVGYLILYPFNLTARQVVINEIATGHHEYGDSTSIKVYELGKMYLEHLIRPCEASLSYFQTID